MANYYDLENFDWQEYLAGNPDVANSGFSESKKSTYQHYTTHGQYEGRTFTPTNADKSSFDVVKKPILDAANYSSYSLPEFIEQTKQTGFATTARREGESTDDYVARAPWMVDWKKWLKEYNNGQNWADEDGNLKPITGPLDDVTVPWNYTWGGAPTEELDYQRAYSLWRSHNARYSPGSDMPFLEEADAQWTSLYNVQRFKDLNKPTNEWDHSTLASLTHLGIMEWTGGKYKWNFDPSNQTAFAKTGMGNYLWNSYAGSFVNPETGSTYGPPTELSTLIYQNQITALGHSMDDPAIAAGYEQHYGFLEDQIQASQISDFVNWANSPEFDRADLGQWLNPEGIAKMGLTEEEGERIWNNFETVFNAVKATNTGNQASFLAALENSGIVADEALTKQSGLINTGLAADVTKRDFETENITKYFDHGYWDPFSSVVTPTAPGTSPNPFQIVAPGTTPITVQNFTGAISDFAVPSALGIGAFDPVTGAQSRGTLNFGGGINDLLDAFGLGGGLGDIVPHLPAGEVSGGQSGYEPITVNFDPTDAANFDPENILAGIDFNFNEIKRGLFGGYADSKQFTNGIGGEGGRGFFDVVGDIAQAIDSPISTFADFIFPNNVTANNNIQDWANRLNLTDMGDVLSFSMGFVPDPGAGFIGTMINAGMTVSQSNDLLAQLGMSDRPLGFNAWISEVLPGGDTASSLTMEALLEHINTVGAEIGFTPEIMGEIRKELNPFWFLQHGVKIKPEMVDPGAEFPTGSGSNITSDDVYGHDSGWFGEGIDTAPHEGGQQGEFRTDSTSDYDNLYDPGTGPDAWTPADPNSYTPDPGETGSPQEGGGGGGGYVDRTEWRNPDSNPYPDGSVTPGGSSTSTQTTQPVLTEEGTPLWPDLPDTIEPMGPSEVSGGESGYTPNTVATPAPSDSLAEALKNFTSDGMYNPGSTPTPPVPTAGGGFTIDDMFASFGSTFGGLVGNPLAAAIQPGDLGSQGALSGIGQMLSYTPPPVVPVITNSPVNPGGFKGMWCFAGNTMVTLGNGHTKRIDEMKLGDITMGGIVTEIQSHSPQPVHFYKGILVTKDHPVLEDGNWIHTHKSKFWSKHSIDTVPVFCLVTTAQRIYIAGIEFGDGTHRLQIPQKAVG